MSNLRFQLASQFYRYGKRGEPRRSPGGYLISQIFFPTDDARLDAGDKAVLDALVDTYGPSLLRPPELRFVGHADFRGTDSHNYRLGLRRARAVDSYVVAKLHGKGHRFIEVTSESRGERDPSGKGVAMDRRVDVYSSFVHRRPPIVLPQEVIEGRYTGPLSNRFKFRTVVGAGVGIFGAAGQVFTIQIQNSRTHRTATYTYAGVGIGIGVQINRPTGWDEKLLPDGLWLDVDDFEGPGRAHAVGAGEVGVVLEFDGPKERGKATDSLGLTFTGLDIYAGFNRDAAGHWYKR